MSKPIRYDVEVTLRFEVEAWNATDAIEAIEPRLPPGKYDVQEVSARRVREQPPGTLPGQVIDATEGQSPDDLLLVEEVSEVLRVPIETLRSWRSKGNEGPRSFKQGRRIMYQRRDVAAWVAEVREGENR